MGSPDYGRLIEHHVAAARGYPGVQVETVVFWGRPQPPRPAAAVWAGIPASPPGLPAHHGWRGNAAALADRRGRRQALDHGEILLFATLPLMHHPRPMWDVVAAAVPLTMALPSDLQRGFVWAMGALAYSALDPAQRASLLEVLGRMPVGEELFEDLREQGREQGRQEGEIRGELRRARAAVLEAFAARFEQVPQSVRSAVAETDELALLSAWHRLAVRAPDIASAEQAVLGTR